MKSKLFMFLALMVVATVLVNRGIRSPEEAAALRSVSLSQLRAPFELKGIDGAVARIADAVRSGEKILVFGDYDVDGVTATAVLIEFLRAAGARVSYYIPDRRQEGYGMKPEHIRQQAADAGVDLVITADAAEPTRNLMPAILDAVRAYATLEEIAMAMETAFGTYVEPAVV